MAPTATLTILIVDDDADTLDVLCQVLSRDGHECLAASDGAEARAFFQNHDVALALVDVDLPDVTGVRLLREFKRRRPEVPVMLMTGYPSNELLFEACEGGADRYLTKPLDLQVVRRLVSKTRDAVASYHVAMSRVEVKRTSVLVRWSRWIVGR